MFLFSSREKKNLHQPFTPTVKCWNCYSCFPPAEMCPVRIKNNSKRCYSSLPRSPWARTLHQLPIRQQPARRHRRPLARQHTCRLCSKRAAAVDWPAVDTLNPRRQRARAPAHSRSRRRQWCLWKTSRQEVNKPQLPVSTHTFMF